LIVARSKKTKPSADVAKKEILETPISDELEFTNWDEVPF